MKKTVVVGMLALLLASCKNEVPSAPAEPAPVRSMPPPALPEKTTPELPQETQPEGTSVKVGSDGVSVKNKAGEKKTNIEVENGKAAVEVK